MVFTLSFVKADNAFAQPDRRADARGSTFVEGDPMVVARSLSFDVAAAGVGAPAERFEAGTSAATPMAVPETPERSLV